jgi:hypothetical protein
MIHTAKTVGILQAVAMTVGVALFLWSTGLPTLFRTAEAASITNASDTLSNSAPSLNSNHTIAFEIETAMTAGQTIQLTFANEFTIPSLGVEDFDLTASGTEQTLAGSNGSGIWGVSTSSQTITFTSPSNVPQATNTIFSIEIGNHALSGGSGDTQIQNPSATSSYIIDIGGTMPDSGQVRVAIIDQVTVSASVDTTLTFAVSGVASGSSVNGTTTSTTTSSVALPFGTLPVGGSRVVAHDLTVTTNASQGYTVTVVQTQALQSTTGATIDGFIDGSDTNTPTAWQAPSGLVADPDTYGHWALTSEDTNIIARSGPGQFGSNQWVSPSTTPIAIMGHDDPVMATTTRIGYQAGITALQEAGDDYTTTLRYVATPVF